MRQSNITHGHYFTMTYRADCIIDCEKYVGPTRKSIQEAEADAQKHKSVPAYKDHVVKIEVTQSFHI
jgi:hypothetical protein